VPNFDPRHAIEWRIVMRRWICVWSRLDRHAIFHQQGFSQATVIGEVTQGPVGLTVR
jgi:hypothetical protein